MSERINLPSGGWFEVREAREVTERSRRPIRYAAANLTGLEGGAAFEAWDRVVDLATVALAVSWSLTQPLTTDGLLDIDPADADSIRAVIEPLMSALLPNFGPSGVADPKADTPA
jgi:hypothetical protein